MTIIKQLLLLTLCLAGILQVFGQNSTCTPHILSTLSQTAPNGETTLNINYPQNLPAQVTFVYYRSTDNTVQVDISYCSSDAGISATLEKLSANFTSGALYMYLAGDGSEEHSTSPASRLTASLTLLLSALFGSLFIFPKSRFSGVLVICMVCIAFSAAATNDNTITVNVYLPSQITQVCINGNTNCFAPTIGGQPTTPPSNFTGLVPTNPPSDAPTPAPTEAPTPAPTPAPTSAPTPAPTGSTTGTPTTTTTTGAPTSGAPTSTLSPAAKHFNLRILILSDGIPTGYTVVLGADWARLAFASVGMPYDYIVMNSSVDLTSSLSTTGVGKYSGIVSVYSLQGADPLSAAQNALITAYQQAFGVKWVIVNDQKATGLSGITTESLITNAYFDVSFAPQFAQYGKFLNQSATVNTLTTNNWSPWQKTPCAYLPVTITDTTTVTPVLNAQQTNGQTNVAAAVFKMADGTEQLHYFLSQGADYIHSMAFASVMVNWISPGGMFIGARRLVFTVQPDDLFLGSYVWNLTTHSNPVTSNDTWYRISADDLQNLADNMDTINAALPKGSYVTVEWPTNFGGINNLYYTRGDPVDALYEKSQNILDKFYYLSHTWDHPCTLDDLNTTAGHTIMKAEVSQNKAYAPGFFGNKMYLWSNTSMITPCVQGLYNGGVLQAMVENGINACVSDESVGTGTVDYEPLTPYHGVYSSAGSPNDEAGVYFVPRQALDIDYCARTPEDVEDEYNTNEDADGVVDSDLTFDEIMVMQRMYAIQNLIAFRYDPYMLHQTNTMMYNYADPAPDTRFGFGANYNTSLVAFFMQRVLGDAMLYYTLPIVTVQMDNLVKKFQQRQTMDACGLTATLGLNADGQIVDLSVTSQAACQMSLSGGVTLGGSTVEMETVGVETTAWIDFNSASTQSWSFSTPIAL